MTDKDTYYECKCRHYDGCVLLRETCKEWADKVENAIEKHRIDKAWNVAKTKRWTNSRLKKINQHLNKSCFVA